MALEGVERRILQTILGLQGESSLYVEDKKIADKTQIDLRDVRDWLETLEGKEFVQRARPTEGDSAYITANGRLALKHAAHAAEATSVRSLSLNNNYTLS
jgi:CTP-dependent riboflavin kinase